MSSIRRSNFLSVLAYISVICVGVILALSWILSAIHIAGAGSFISALQVIAECLAYFVIACYSFGYAKAKGIWWVVAWVVSVVLIIVFKVLNIL